MPFQVLTQLPEDILVLLFCGLQPFPRRPSTKSLCPPSFTFRQQPGDPMVCRNARFVLSPSVGICWRWQWPLRGSLGTSWLPGSGNVVSVPLCGARLGSRLRKAMLREYLVAWTRERNASWATLLQPAGSGRPCLTSVQGCKAEQRGEIKISAPLGCVRCSYCSD